jgi:hypothetical protein
MGDNDEQVTEAYKKQERIRKEREKAAKAIEEEEKRQGKVNLAYLDPASTSKVKGFSRGSEAKRKSLERLANFAVTIGLGGLIVNLPVSFVDVRGLGMAGSTMISAIAGISGIMLIVALFVAVYTIIAAFVARKKNNTEVKTALRTALIMFVIVGGYLLIKFLSVRIY